MVDYFIDRHVVHVSLQILIEFLILRWEMFGILKKNIQNGILW